MHNTSSPIIIAIDPGYDRCGVAVVTERHGTITILASECITTHKSDDHTQRLAYIHTTLTDIITTWQPSYLALETLFFSVNKKTAIKVAEARGAILVLAGLHNLSLIELSPQAVKVAVTGVGNADKKAVEKMVTLLTRIPMDQRLDDEIDAIALGIAGLQEIKYVQRA